MTTIDAALFSAGSAVLVLGLVGSWVKRRLWLSEPMLCILLGAVMGPSGLGFVSQHQLPNMTLFKELAHLTLGISVMEAALRLPPTFVRDNARSLALAFLLLMPLSWLTAAALGWALMGYAMLPALVLGALVTPTDPVLASTVVNGGRAAAFPVRTRNLLMCESGANDGLGQLFLMLPVLLLSATVGLALGDWVKQVLGWGVLAAVAIGLALGEFAGWMMVWARRYEPEDHTPTATVGLALTATVLTAVQMIGSGSILAVFAAGLTMGRHAAAAETTHARMQSSVSRFFTLPFFLVLGTMLPWEAWIDLGIPGIIFALAAVTLRRLPWWLLFQRWMPAIRRPREAVFMGFFGPVGTAAIYYAIVADERSGLNFWPVVTLAVVVSAVVHGLSTTPASWAFTGPAGDTDKPPSGEAEPRDP